METKIGLLYLIKFVWKVAKEKKVDFFYLFVAILHIYPEGYEIAEGIAKLAETASVWVS